jgi:SET domain-containing protein
VHHTCLFAIDDDVVIDAAVGGNEARFINHSCAPNCDAVIDDERIWIETIRKIARGEELAYDYAFMLEERHTPAAKRRYPCTCGALDCRGTILGRKR